MRRVEKGELNNSERARKVTVRPETHRFRNGAATERIIRNSDVGTKRCAFPERLTPINSKGSRLVSNAPGALRPGYLILDVRAAW